MSDPYRILGKLEPQEPKVSWFKRHENTIIPILGMLVLVSIPMFFAINGFIAVKGRANTCKVKVIENRFGAGIYDDDSDWQAQAFFDKRIDAEAFLKTLPECKK